MNRVLKRPMFRLGGSAEGITSGLDAPNINASRQGYDNGGDVMQRPGPMTEEEILEQKSVLEKVMGADPEKESMAPGSLSSFLTNFSLNLAGQPGGNLAGAIGKAGAPALSKWQEARQLDRLKGKKEDRELSLEAYRTAAGMKEKEWDAYQEAMGKDPEKGRDPYAFEVQIKELGTRISDNQDRKRKVEDIDSQISALEANAQMEESAKRKAIAELEKEKNEHTATIIINDSIIEKIQGRNPRTAILEKGIIEEFGIYSPQHLDFMKQHGLTKEAKARGGRVGLAMGSQPEPLMGEMVEEVEETGTDQVADLTYNELRSRLPKEINNDIVSLLANSKQALVDFANIITQQDVDNFNNVYNVDLVLPQEG